jgi:hypothetical protein
MSGKYFDWYVADLAWREDMRQETNGWQAWRFLWKCLSSPTSPNLCGNWQGNKLPGEVLLEDEE